MTEIAVELPESDDPTSIADWLESVLILKGQAHASKAWIRQQLKGALFPGTGTGSGDLEPNDLEVAIEGVLAEVQRRKIAVGDGYPISADALGSGVAVEMKSRHLPYVFMLLISVSPELRAQKRLRDVEASFEEVVADATRSYLGSGSRAIRFGSPATGRRPKSFANALDWLSAQLGVPRGVAKAGSSTGDRGLDVIGWLPFPDGHAAFISVLVQCTVQKKWYNKGLDVPSSAWASYIDFGMVPATALAIPFAVPRDDDRWDAVRRRSTVVFDRLRLAHHASALRAPVTRRIKKWSKREARALGARLRDLDWAS